MTTPEDADGPAGEPVRTFADLKIHPAVLQAVADVGYVDARVVEAEVNAVDDRVDARNRVLF